jgi:hypothetical protein
MKNSPIIIKTGLVAAMALAMALCAFTPRTAAAFDFFGLFKAKEKAPAAQLKLAPAEKQKMMLTKNVKLVNNMRAFRMSPQELKDLIAAIITSSKEGTITKLDIQKLPSYQMLRKNLATTGLPSIQSSIVSARGTEFKTALVIVMANLLDDKTLAPSMRQKIILTLEEASLTPYRFGDRHQFVALMVLTRQLDKVQFKAFAKDFIKAHRGSKDGNLQLAIYRGAFKEMKLDRAKKIKTK